MLANAQVVTQVPRSGVEAAQVAILMCTRNGAAFLEQQLQSIADQTCTNWRLFISDDGSTDQTREIIKRFAGTHHQSVTIRNGPGKGVCANFLSLAADPTIEADYFAFCDQDDIWYPDKLQRALAWLTTVGENVPAFYCGRTELISIDGQSCGFSSLFTRSVTFQNALVQNLGGGNTMVFNRAAKKLLEAAGTFEVVVHDWWVYQLVSAAGGSVHYDSQPVLKYRQHPNNLIGSNLGWRARLVRLRMVLSGRFRDWNDTNIAALRQVPAQLIQPKNREVLELFAKARSASFLQRLYYLWRSGVYRQTLLGDFGLIVAAIFRRL
jgi:glycosyltransferase involved in cell wall biosynthesis